MDITERTSHRLCRILLVRSAHKERVVYMSMNIRRQGSWGPPYCLSATICQWILLALPLKSIPLFTTSNDATLRSKGKIKGVKVIVPSTVLVDIMKVICYTMYVILPLHLTSSFSLKAGNLGVILIFPLLHLLIISYQAVTKCMSYSFFSLSDQPAIISHLGFNSR